MNEWIKIHNKITTSTNDDAIAYSAKADGTEFVISADQQTKGRGRRGRTWIGLQDNLFMSLGVRFAPYQYAQAVFITSLALARSILYLSPTENVTIKWPNDVLVRRSKVSGILLEKGENDYLIIGVGVNIVSSPPEQEVMYPTISLQDVGISIDKQEFMTLFLNNFSALCQQYAQKGFAPIREEWLTLATGLGEEIRIMQEQTEKRGIYSGVDDNGLLLLDNNGKIEKISAGDVFVIKGN